MFSYNNFRPRGIRAWAVVTAATALTFAGTLTAAQAEGESSPGAPLHDSSAAACEFRTFDVRAEQTQGLPGQYQLAYSKKNDALWATGTVLGGASTTATLARIDPQTMKIEKTVALDTVPYIPKGGKEAAGVQLKGPFGIDVDEVNNTVWVTNTVANEVTAYDQATLKEVFSTSKISAEDRAKIEFAHPREVRIADGKAFVGVRGSVVVFDTKTYAFLQKINVADAEDKTTAVMNMSVDESEGKAYFPVRMRDEVKVYDLKDLSHPVQVIKLHKKDPDANLYASDVAVDQSLNEIYVSSQGEKGKNSGVGVYDKTTGEFKAWIDLGGRALSLDADEANDVVYLTDFDGNSPDKGVYVIDGRTHTVAATVAKNSMGAPFGVNDVVVTPKGVFAVDKGGAYKNAEVPFTIDYRTGEFTTSSTSVKGVQNKAPEGAPADWQPAEPTPINADTLLKLTTTPTGAVKGQNKTASGAETQVKTVESKQDPEAKVTGATVVSEGQSIKVSGTGWKYPNGSEGSKVAVKYDKGTVSINGDPVIATVEADHQGNWELSLPYPTTGNSSVKEGAWGPGTTHTLSFLSGSLKDGDVSRGANLEITVAQQTWDAPEALRITPTTKDFQGYGPLVGPRVGDAVTAPGEPGKQDPSPTPSPSAPENPQAPGTDNGGKGSDEQVPGGAKDDKGPGGQDPGTRIGDKGSGEHAPGESDGGTGMDGGMKGGQENTATEGSAVAGEGREKSPESSEHHGEAGDGVASNGTGGNGTNGNGPVVGASGSQSQNAANGSDANSQTPASSKGYAQAGQPGLAHTGAGKLMWLAGAGAAATAAGVAVVTLRRKRAH
ncbi:YncE family protein [Rothia uropygialis]|uniref:YncE family protein n=1 Tax=Kocuria sp. 36 TaxID=1415402 RepID=UPI00101BFFD0|nr:YncE family protein [Kocuria sp. 36]